LYRCTEEGGTLKVIEVKSGPLLQADLDENDCFIIDNGPNGLCYYNYYNLISAGFDTTKDIQTAFYDFIAKENVDCFCGLFIF